MSFNKAIRAGVLIICGYLGTWLLVILFMGAVIYGRASDIPEWLYWVGTILALPVYFVGCNPSFVIDTVENAQLYRKMYMDYRDECRSKSMDITHLKAERQRLQSENAELKKKLREPVKVRLCTKKGCRK